MIAKTNGGHGQQWTVEEEQFVLDAIRERYTFLKATHGLQDIPVRKAPRRFQFWSEEEDTLILEALGRGLKQGAIKALLPERNTTQVQNRIATLRSRLKNVCTQCKGKLPKDSEHAKCVGCRKNSRGLQMDRRAKLKAAGICVMCAKEPADASLTMCEKCLLNARSYNPVPKKSRSRQPHQGLLRWVGTPAVAAHVRRFPRGFKVVDLFGGSAAYTLKASSKGLHAKVYNDAHPGLVALVASVKAGNGAHVVNLCRDLAKKPPEELVALYKRGTTLHQEGLAAVTLMLARAIKDKNLRKLDIDKVYTPPKSLKDRFKRAARELQRTEVTNLDFAEAIDRFDAPDTFFFVDPPYIGTAKFEHNLTGRHRDLVEKLMGIQGRFLLVTHSSRASALMIRPMPFVWRADAYLGPLRIRELLATNYELSGVDEDSMDWPSFGL